MDWWDCSLLPTYPWHTHDWRERTWVSIELVFSNKQSVPNKINPSIPPLHSNPLVVWITWASEFTLSSSFCCSQTRWIHPIAPTITTTPSTAPTISFFWRVVSLSMTNTDPRMNLLNKKIWYCTSIHRKWASIDGHSSREDVLRCWLLPRVSITKVATSIKENRIPS